MKRNIFLILVGVISLLELASCNNSSSKLMPNVSGKAGEIIVVMDKAGWEGNLGNGVRELLASDCPYLVQPEPLYSLVNVIPSGFGDLFKVHRNIIIVGAGPQVDSASIIFKHDVWAAPQCVIQITAPSVEETLDLIDRKSEMILSSFEQAERNRVIANSIKYEELSLSRKVSEVFGGSPHFPMGYQMKRLGTDFAWVADEKQYTMQDILIYRYPNLDDEPFSKENILKHRNEILKDNIPGMFEGTYMTTSDYFPPQVSYTRYLGRDFAQMRGYWEVAGDYMGGPFVSHSFYSPDGGEIIVAEAFVYAPKYDKRQYLRQVESILFSWEWNKVEISSTEKQK